MSNKTELLQPKLSNAREFLAKGYSLREIAYKGVSVKIYSKLISHLRYRFRSRGKGVQIDHRAVVDGAGYISIGEDVFVQRNAWLVVPLFDMPTVEDRAYLAIGRGTRIGPNCIIAAANRVEIDEHVLFGPNVYVSDHAHNYEDVDRPISHQGIFSRGTVKIERGSWLGINSIIYAGDGPLTIGEHSVVAGNSFVRRSVDPYTVVAGNPARPVRRYDHSEGKWISVE
jgi:carbonic anhydrase/acetyltransferase-like protein (isoleucine patch superfamily)